MINQNLKKAELSKDNLSLFVLPVNGSSSANRNVSLKPMFPSEANKIIIKMSAIRLVLIFMSVYLSIRPYVYPSSLCLSIRPYVCQFVLMSVNSFLCLSIVLMSVHRLGRSRYRDANPVPTSPLTDDIVTETSGPVVI